MTIHRLMYWLFLAAGMILCGVAGYVLTDSFTQWVNSSVLREPSQVPENTTRAGFTLAGLLVGVLIGNSGFRLLAKAARSLEEAEPDEKLAIGLGIIVAALITLALYPLLFAIGGKLGWAITLVAFVVVVYLSCVTFLSMKEYLPLTAQISKKSRGVKILDTNVIIDGRILDILRTGFLEGRFYIPGFVLDELQKIADSEDALKRARGRRGLEMLKRLQQEFQLDVRSQDRLAPHVGDGVDARLVRLARAMHADIITNDYNLNKVVELQDVRVLNINELSEAVRIHVLPGEELTVTPIREGKEADQGVAYLEDGTMVVVEGGKAYLNSLIEVNITSVLQTGQGKMIFAELRDEHASTDDGYDRGLRAYTGGRKRRPVR